MKRFSLLWLLLATATQYAAAQTTTASGTVTDQKNTPLRYVFVGDIEHKYATLTDSLGNFQIKIQPDSKLEFGLKGYSDTIITADKAKGDLHIALKSQGTATASNTGTFASRVTEQTNSIVQASIGYGGTIAPSHQKGEVRGNQYLFNAFVHGYFINANGILIYNPDYLSNYDKVNGTFLLTKDRQSILAISWDQTQSFTLFNNAGERFDFEKMPSIDISHYVQVLAAGPKYKILKLIKTKFVRSDYVNNGVTAHGNDYDEFIDDADYYVFDVQSKQTQKLSLRKKSIKEDFAKEADKVNKYLSSNSGDINDTYLSKLGDFMNQ